ncbi:G-type lectin S-receptor-like serine/threonine-protein kinase [Thalictrum thalictroides]|uniref:Receptor-like serine/threonine-protein kinase n=1 Tax=Thalictrum thalictroides TaxID=46969 RepID=A0A7J6W3S0_THATH|nr:G-type lectin S-receptor-like serine/threonine-protein kinase [Thalictrum thalictroides]
MMGSARSQTWCFLFFFFSFSYFCAAADTISSGQSLTQNQTLISNGGNFELGFIRPGNSLNYYIGIWYKKVSVQNKTLVWVANRNSPITPDHLSTSEFKLLDDGNLVVLNQFKIAVWSTNLTMSNNVIMNSSQAVLKDDGNLVLRNGLKESDIYWQTFDFPSETWLPGGKLKYDNRTKKPHLLTSWKNPNDPSEGLFSLELLPAGNEYVIRWNLTEPYWTSGAWNTQNQIFSGVPEMRLNYIYNFSYIQNENESYFTYSVYNSSITSRFVMDFSGQIKQLTWTENTQNWFLFWSQPRTQCEVYAFCGPFGVCSQKGFPFCTCMEGFEPRSSKDWNLNDFSGGCVRRTSLECGDKDQFYTMSNVKLPAKPQSLPAAASADECRLACLNNCSCNAYAYTSSKCSIWDGNMLSLQQFAADENDGGPDLYLRLAASEIKKPPGGKNNGSNSTGIIVGAAVGIVALLCLVLVLVWRWRMRQSIGTSKTVEGSLVAFTYRDLQSATKNFSEKLGGGGFGSVFKGILPDSTGIAVKKLEGLGQGEKQFRSEVSTIGTIQHVNLVRLRGFCSEGDKRLLVYDYMPNSSLDSHMFRQQEDDKMLNWKTRYQIALGTARGLTYLHEKCRDCIIHCDIKPENILLDAEFCPKVADFGLAKLIGRDFSRVLTTMRGTRGYLAPEWISGVAITAKADVYSYGMMLFEIISGRRNSDHSEDGKIMFFPTWAARKITEEEDALALLDSRLEGDVNEEELTRACKVACWCIQDDESHRPSMGQVVQILEGILEVNSPPIPRTLQVLVENEENIHFYSDTTSNRSSQVQSTSSTSSHTKSSISSTSLKSQKD